MTCEVCGGPLGVGRLQAHGVCSGCEHHGSAWAYRQIERLWNVHGLTEPEIGRELGYRPGVVRQLIARLRHKGVALVIRRPA